MKAKQSNSSATWDKFKSIWKETDRELRKERRTCINELSVTKDVKMFWEYIKSRKKDSIGIQVLKSNNHLGTDDKSKAEILAKQFHSVFTTEELPSLPDSRYADMEDI